MHNINIKNLVGLVLLLVLLLGSTACVTRSVYKDLTIVDKDKAAGFIYMAADYNYDDEPIIDLTYATSVALQQCKNWLYKGAIPLEGHDIICISGAENNCERYKMVYTYQCLTEQDLKDYDEGALKLKTKKIELNKIYKD